MDKTEKALKKLSAKERDEIRRILFKLNSHNFKGLDVKKLRGRDDIFRARKGNFRIIYRVENKKVFILTIERRRESTYEV